MRSDCAFCSIRLGTTSYCVAVLDLIPRHIVPISCEKWLIGVEAGTIHISVEAKGEIGPVE